MGAKTFMLQFIQIEMSKIFPTHKKILHLQMDIFCHFKLFFYDRRNHFSFEIYIKSLENSKTS